MNSSPVFAERERGIFRDRHPRVYALRLEHDSFHVHENR